MVFSCNVRHLEDKYFWKYLDKYGWQYLEKYMGFILSTNIVGNIWTNMNGNLWTNMAGYLCPSILSLFVFFSSFAQVAKVFLVGSNGPRGSVCLNVGKK